MNPHQLIDHTIKEPTEIYKGLNFIINIREVLELLVFLGKGQI